MSRANMHRESADSKATTHRESKRAKRISWAFDLEHTEEIVQYDDSPVRGRPPLNLFAKVGYAIGQAPERTMDALVAGFGMVYYNQVVGLDAELVGTGMVIALLVDALLDPMVGNFSDKTCSTLFGRRHGFMYFSIVPICVSMVLVYQVPDTSWPQGALFVWLLVVIISFRVSVTCYTIPHLSLGAELATDYNERTSLMAWNALFGYIIGPGTSFLGLQMMHSKGGIVYYNSEGTPRYQYESGLLNPNNYPVFLFVAFLLVYVTGMLCPIMTQHFVPYLPRPNKDPFTLKDFAINVWSALKLRSFQVIVIGFLFYGLTLGIQEASLQLGGTYYWKFETQHLALFPLMYPVAAVVAKLTVSPLTKKFDKKSVLVAATIIYGAVTLTPPTLNVLGWYPTDYTLKLTLCLVAYWFNALCNILTNICVMSMLADIADEYELQCGVRHEGLFYAARTFFGKATSGFGHFATGWLLTAIGMPHSVSPSEVEQTVINRLAIIIGPVAAVGSIIAGFIYLFYNLTRDRHADIKYQISVAREQMKNQEASYGKEANKRWSGTSASTAKSAKSNSSYTFNTFKQNTGVLKDISKETPPADAGAAGAY